METVNFILSGLGGQGILFMTKVLARTALAQGKDILGAETHGMAQRGGSVVSHLKIGGAENSLVNTGSAHFLLALDAGEAYRNLAFLAPGGRMIVSTAAPEFPEPTVARYLEKQKMRCRCLPATQIAMDHNAPRSANLALIGFMAALDDSPFAIADVRETINTITPPPFRTLNLKVFDAGAATGGT